MRPMSVVLLCWCVCLPQLYAYTQVAWSGPGAETNEQGPRVFKAASSDLIFPKVFNSTTNELTIPSNHAPEPPALPTTPTTSPTSAAPATTAAATDSTGLEVGAAHATNYAASQLDDKPPIFVTPRASDIEPTDSSSSHNRLPPPPQREYNNLETATANGWWQPPQQPREQSAPNNAIRGQLQLGQSVVERQRPPEQQQQRQQPPPTQLTQPPHNYLRSQQQQQHQQQQNNQQLQRRQQRLPSPYSATGRAVDYQPALTQQLQQFGNGRPVYYTPNSAQKPKVYRKQQQRQPPRQPAQLTDRFSPGEAVAAMHFINNNHKHKQRPSGALFSAGGGKQPAASNVVQSFVPQSDVYAFPPNLAAKYPRPSNGAKAAAPSGKVNSYLAPPSGPFDKPPEFTSPLDGGTYSYAGPVNSDYLPPHLASGGGDDDDSKKPPADDDAMDGDGDTVGVLPASAMDMKDSGADDGMSVHDHPAHDDKEYPTPPPGWVEEHPDSTHPPPSADDHDHSPPMMMPDHSPPMMMPDDHPHPKMPYFFDHDHHDYPTLIYDHDHHHHEHHTTPSPMTTMPPPPEPRVKKYSYFYIGRKLWYIPLYFTVWFSFYVLWLIVKSIARHKVNLPNHYVNRRSLDALEERPDEHINRLTVKVLQYIDDFQRKQAQE